MGFINIELEPLTRELCHELFYGWENDPMTYSDLSVFEEYNYDESKVDAYFDSKQSNNRILLAVIVDKVVVGEVQLKNINYELSQCELSIYI